MSLDWAVADSQPGPSRTITRHSKPRPPSIPANSTAAPFHISSEILTPSLSFWERSVSGGRLPGHRPSLPFSDRLKGLALLLVLECESYNHFAPTV